MSDMTHHEAPEKHELRLGFIPLTDCCVLAVAREKGFFQSYDLDVTLSREASWANIRDKVAVGALDGAHMLAGIPIAATLGLGFSKKPMITAFSMDLNGNAVTVSNALYDRIRGAEAAQMTPARTAQLLKQVMDKDRKDSGRVLRFATVFPFSNHNYQLRYWMAAAGIDPDRDVELTVIPPQYMVDNLASGAIDGFCAGEPWNSHAVRSLAGKILVTGYDIWNNAPEKVFGVTQDWAQKYPATHRALIKAMLEAARWIDLPENREEVVSIIAGAPYTNADAAVVRMSMTGTFQYSHDSGPVPLPDFNVFHRYLANFPWRSHAMWIITQMYRWGQLVQYLNIREVAESVYRPDIYRETAAMLGFPLPGSDDKCEGGHAGNWQLETADSGLLMGSDSFIDGGNFDPGDPVAYLKRQNIRHPGLDIERLAQANHRDQ